MARPQTIVVPSGGMGSTSKQTNVDLGGAIGLISGLFKRYRDKKLRDAINAIDPPDNGGGPEGPPTPTPQAAPAPVPQAQAVPQAAPSAPVAPAPATARVISEKPAPKRSINDYLQDVAQVYVKHGKPDKAKSIMGMIGSADKRRVYKDVAGQQRYESGERLFPGAKKPPTVAGIGKLTREDKALDDNENLAFALDRTLKSGGMDPALLFMIKDMEGGEEFLKELQSGDSERIIKAFNKKITANNRHITREDLRGELYIEEEKAPPPSDNPPEVPKGRDLYGGYLEE